MSGGLRISLEGIKKTYGHGSHATEALKGVDLTIEPGEMVAISGPSGSGKSTLLNLIGALDRDYTGTLRVGDVEPARTKDRALARFRASSVGFIFQNFHLLPHLSIRENVLVPTAFSPDGSDAGARAMALLERVGLADRADARPDELSGGQQQRVAIARALINRSALLLADEPTGALDSTTGQVILDLLTEINAEKGTTVIIVTHEDAVSARARRRVHVVDGRINQDTRCDATSSEEDLPHTSTGES